jgi:hypothetical protein
MRLYRDEVDFLPELCVCCGEPATTAVAKSYPTKIKKQPSGGEVGVAILVLVLTVGHVWLASGEEAGTPWQVALPVCERHRTHWRNRSLLIFGGFGVLLVLLAIVLTQLDDPGMIGVFLGVLGGVLAWAVASVVIHETSLKPAEANEHCLVLRPVAEPFVLAMEEQRRRAVTS